MRASPSLRVLFGFPANGVGAMPALPLGIRVPYALSTRLLHPATGDTGEGNKLQGRLALPQPKLPCHNRFKTAVRQVSEPIGLRAPAVA